MSALASITTNHLSYRGISHANLFGNFPCPEPLLMQCLDLMLLPVRGGWSAQPHSPSLRSMEARADPLNDNLPLELSYGCKDVELKMCRRIVIGGIYAL